MSNELKPGKDVVWLQVPFSALPGDKNADTKLPNGANYGFPVSTMHIVANKARAEKTRQQRNCLPLCSYQWQILTPRTPLCMTAKPQKAIFRATLMVDQSPPAAVRWLVNEALAAQKYFYSGG